MPGSHGGGGGGSHSSHSGTHSNGSSQSFSQKGPFPGSRRYYYYDAYGNRSIFYSNMIPKRTKISSFIGGTIFSFLFSFGIIVGIFFLGVFPSKMTNPCYVTNYIYDNAQVIDNTDTLESQMKEFYDKTGVQPVVYTASLDEYTNEYGYYSDYSLEMYGIDVYNNLFNDEGHWLLVYAQNIDRTEWYWVEIYGDDTSNVITDALYEKFANTLQPGLENDSISITDTFIHTYKVATEKALTWDEDRLGSAIGLGVFVLVLCCIVFGGAAATYKQIKVINSYCDYKDKNGGKDFFEEVDPSEYGIDSSMASNIPAFKNYYNQTKKEETSTKTNSLDDQFKINDDDYKINKEDF